MQSRDRGALSALISALLAVCFVVLVTNTAEGMTNNVLYHYQTLFSAVFAFGGAIVGALAIYKQITLQRNISNEDRVGRMSAARALLPLALSSISQYAEDCSELLVKLREECDDDGILPDHISISRIPPVPIDGMQTIKEVIEFSKPVERNTPAELISRLQIQRSRMANFYNRRADHLVTDLNISACIRDTVEIYARSSAMYDFSRRRTSDMPAVQLSDEQLVSAFHNLRIFDETLDEILEECGMAPLR